MKDSGNSAAVGRAPEPTPERDEFVSRKLIRPALSTQQHRSDPADRLTSAEQRVPRKSNAPEQTHAETFYFQKQVQGRTPMVVVLKDGEELHGWIEWYDRNSIKLNRNGAANLLLYKANIKYIFKAGENGRR